VEIHDGPCYQALPNPEDPNAHAKTDRRLGKGSCSCDRSPAVIDMAAYLRSYIDKVPCGIYLGIKTAQEGASCGVGITSSSLDRRLFKILRARIIPW